MRQLVELYRDVAIYRTEEASVPERPSDSGDFSMHEARLGGWRIVGPIDAVRRQIGRLLDDGGAPPKHKSLPMI